MSAYDRLSRPSRDAVDLVRSELSDAGRGALRHLMSNALVPVVYEVSLHPGLREESDLRDGVRELRELVDLLVTADTET
jgi:hypothetical protein